MTYVQLGYKPPVANKSNNQPPVAQGFQADFSVTLRGVGAELNIQAKEPWVFFGFDGNLLKVDKNANLEARADIAQ